MTAEFQLRAWVLWCCLALWGACFCAAQQDPLTIRVGSGRIVVPVAWVGPVRCEYSDEGHGDACWWDIEEVPASIQVVTMALLHKIDPTPFSLGILSSGKFHLSEDGNELPIQSLHEVAERDVDLWLDNLGAHKEQAFGPKGIWSTLDLTPESLKGAYSGHFFLITYAPPASPEGSCHTVAIKVPHESHLVYNKKYCNLPPPISDPLQGTTGGAKLEAYLAASKPGSIHPLAQANAFYVAPGKARVEVDVEFPFKEVAPKDWHDGILPSALLIEAHGKDGRVAGRLSEQMPEDAAFAHFNTLGNLKEATEIVTSTRYEGQMDLPPGEYKLAITYSRGKEFGVVQVPLTVDDYDGSRFAISTIALCTRVRKTGAVPAARDFVPLVAGDYEFTPAGDTAFRKGDSLMAYFELYEPALVQPQASLHVNYTMRIRNEKTGAVALEAVQNADSWVQPAKSTIPVAVEPVLSKLNLAPGKYQFQIQATDSTGRSTPMRSAEFSIE
jgi:hypothetical protein